MNISLKQVDRVCLVVVVVVSLLGGYLTVNHVVKKRRQFRVETGLLSKKSREVNLATTSLGELRAALAETKKELNALNERIPESGKIGLLLKQINSLMKQRKIALISLQPLRPRGEQNYLRNPIRLRFTGKFVDIYHLIQDLEMMNRIVVSERIALTRQPDSENCRGELMINVFEHKKTFDLNPSSG